MTAPTGESYANLRWAQRVYTDTDLSWRAKYVGVAVALRYMNRTTLAEVRPGAPRLARELDISEASVKRGFAELCAAGYMRLAKRGSYGRASLYVGLHRKPRSAAKPADTEPCPSCGTNVPKRWKEGAESPWANDGVGTLVCRACAEAA